MITVLDYGAGNLRSVENTLAEIGADYQLVRDADSIRRAESIILPGVGHFGQMMRALNAMQVREALLEKIGAGTPFLGICLGLQALFEFSEEAPELPGLGLYKGTVRRFDEGWRVPHMGWNSLDVRPDAMLLRGVPEVPFVYFAHSYYAPVTVQTCAVCDYMVEFTAVLQFRNVFGVQFHPEKSGPVGLKIMRNFVEHVSQTYYSLS